MIRYYQAEERGHNTPALRLADLEQHLFERVKAMCEWRLGREALLADGPEPDVPMPEPVTLEEIIACLKRVRLSVKRNKDGGRRGYLDFVSRYIV